MLQINESYIAFPNTALSQHGLEPLTSLFLPQIYPKTVHLQRYTTQLTFASKSKTFFYQYFTKVNVINIRLYIFLPLSSPNKIELSDKATLGRGGTALVKTGPSAGVLGPVPSPNTASFSSTSWWKRSAITQYSNLIENKKL